MSRHREGNLDRHAKITAVLLQILIAGIVTALITFLSYDWTW